MSEKIIAKLVEIFQKQQSILEKLAHSHEEKDEKASFYEEHYSPS